MLVASRRREPLTMSTSNDAEQGTNMQTCGLLSSPLSQQGSSSAGPSTPFAARYSPNGIESISPSLRSNSFRTQRSMLSPLSERSYGTSSSARRAGPHMTPMSLPSGGSKARFGGMSGSEGESMSDRLVRKQFRQRCQEVMARDRQRGRNRAVQAQRQGLASSSPPPSDSYSDDTDDFDGSSDLMLMPDEDEEVMRRLMTAEYRKLLRAQEQDGNAQLGWLDPDEVAWLEEETRREEAADSNGRGLEPPPELEDEDEMLAAMYEHACSQQGARPLESTSMANVSQATDDSDADFAWVWDTDLMIDEPKGTSALDMDMDT